MTDRLVSALVWGGIATLTPLFWWFVIARSPSAALLILIACCISVVLMTEDKP